MRVRVLAEQKDNRGEPVPLCDVCSVKWPCVFCPVIPFLPSRPRPARNAGGRASASLPAGVESLAIVSPTSCAELSRVCRINNLNDLEKTKWHFCFGKILGRFPHFLLTYSISGSSICTRMAYFMLQHAVSNRVGTSSSGLSFLVEVVDG